MILKIKFFFSNILTYDYQLYYKNTFEMDEEFRSRLFN